MIKTVHIRCPLCGESVEKLVYRFHIDNERQVIQKIKERNPSWAEHDGACSRCMDYYQTELILQQRILPEIGPYFQVRSADEFIILPTGLRLDADPRFSGKGITICFIDSGFFPHPDLTTFKNRIKLIVDIPNNKTPSPGGDIEELSQLWHGTMTSVVCAGDGYLSKGLYKGIASSAELVLLKVQDDQGHISSTNFSKALQWVLDHHHEYGIRIVNISVGDNETISWEDSKVACLAERLVERGVIVVAAAGNDENGMIKAPANAPHVITVGGIDDDSKLDEHVNKLYHSSYGKTGEAIMKPELLAHAIWIAAPILPSSPEQEESEALHQLLSLRDTDLSQWLEKNRSHIEIAESVLQSKDVVVTRKAALQRIQDCKYISPHYMHVDGTSFAAPIISSVIAQMLEINPSLDPTSIRSLLFGTAKRLENLPVERQGFGMVQARKAILKTLGRPMYFIHDSPVVNLQQKTIAFKIQHECASQVSLAGSFNHWEQDVLMLEPVMNGIWTIEIPMLPAGQYRYKFLIDDKTWIEDINNPFREPDGFNGFNSILMIEN